MCMSPSCSAKNAGIMCQNHLNFENFFNYSIDIFFKKEYNAFVNKFKTEYEVFLSETYGKRGS